MALLMTTALPFVHPTAPANDALPTLRRMEKATHPSIDWSQLWYPGRKQPFTAQEMAQAGSDAPGSTLLAVVAVNFASVAFVALQLAPAGQVPRLTAALVAMAVLGSAVARWLWWRPWRRPLMMAMVGVAAVMLLLSVGAATRIPLREERRAVALVLTVGSALVVAALWVVALWRAQQIEGRLLAQAEREKAVEMARRLAAAQLEPHFLFNSLASLQHWVQTHDPRAAPLLASLTGYLRATLPLFKHPLLAAGEELQAVARYLEVMQARLGAARLQWVLEVEAPLHAALLPPGMLLTLVENAVAHGVEPQLAGGTISVRGERRAGDVVFQVVDNGPGPPAGSTGSTGSTSSTGGVGLANVRQRLALAFGAAGQLTLQPVAGGGCRAEIRLPFSAAWVATDTTAAAAAS